MALRLPFGGALLNAAGAFLGGVAGRRAAAPTPTPVTTPEAPSAAAAGGPPRREAKLPFGLSPAVLMTLGLVGAGLIIVLVMRK